MKKITNILKKLSDLYECNRRIKGYELKKNEAANKRLKKDAADRRASQP